MKQPAQKLTELKVRRILERTQKGEKVAKICRKLGISRPLFYRWIKRLDAKRLAQATKNPQKKRFAREYTLVPVEKRVELIDKVLKEGFSVAAVCRKTGISRTIFYRWLKKLKENPWEAKEKILKVRRARPQRWARQASPKIEKLILSTVAKYPELSVPKIVEVLPVVEGKKPIGYHGVQNILRRAGLNTYEIRLSYSQTQKQQFIPVIVPEFLARSLKLLRFALAPFATIPKIPSIIVSLFSSLPAFLFSFTALAGLVVYLRYLFNLPDVNKFGLILTSVALFFGSIFFLYSLKYYFSLALILRFSRQNPLDDEKERKKGFLVKYLSRLFGSGSNGQNDVSGSLSSGLAPNLESIKLDSTPFVSIHIPLYNERRVAERILKALTNLTYPKDKYEVVVVDDSTDETTDIVKRFEDEYENVKLIHRKSREGFKGGALAKALETMDQRTEFIIVFDADFIPYPDTIEQFLKHFVASCGGLEKVAGSRVAAIQGYQWHVLNKSENWLTGAVRTEYSGSYVVERSSVQLYRGLEQIAGSVYMIRSDILKKFGWGTSITEDFELTLKLYAEGYKVIYTPYIQAPSECVSTLRRLIRQRMRWAEGHTYNIKRMFMMVFTSKHLKAAERIEFAYLSPYYLQAFFLIAGTLSWFFAEAFFRTHLPYWTSLWGWSLVLTNFLSLPLMNISGLFLEGSNKRDYTGVASFVALSYILAPFEAFAALKGLFEAKEGPWFRTPKTGHITDIFTPGHFSRWIRALFPWRGRVAAFSPKASDLNPYLVLASAHNKFNNFSIRPKRLPWLSKGVLASLLASTLLIGSMTRFVPHAAATNPSGTFLLYNEVSTVVTSTVSWQLVDTATPDALDTTTTVSFSKNSANGTFVQWEPGANNSTTQTASCTGSSADGKGWIWDTQFGDAGEIASGTWSFTIRESDDNGNVTGHWDVCVWRVTVSGESIASSTLLFSTEGMSGWPTTDIWNGVVDNPTATTDTVGPFNLSNEYLYVEYYNHVTADGGPGGTRSATFATGDVTEASDPKIVTPTIMIPELAIAFLVAAPFIPLVVHLWIKRRERLQPRLDFIKGAIYG